MTYYLFVVAGVVLGTVWFIVLGFFHEELNSSPVIMAATLGVTTYASVCVLLVVIDAFKKYGWVAILAAVLLGWTGPLLILGYLAHVYLEATSEENEQTRT